MITSGKGPFPHTQEAKLPQPPFLRHFIKEETSPCSFRSTGTLVLSQPDCKLPSCGSHFLCSMKSTPFRHHLHQSSPIRWSTLRRRMAADFSLIRMDRQRISSYHETCPIAFKQLIEAMGARRTTAARRNHRPSVFYLPAVSSLMETTTRLCSLARARACSLSTKRVRPVSMTMPAQPASIMDSMVFTPTPGTSKRWS